MTNHPPKPERRETCPPTYPEEVYDKGWNSGLYAAEAHYESRIEELEDALRELEEAVGDAFPQHFEYPFKGKAYVGERLETSLAAARNLLEGENNE